MSRFRASLVALFALAATACQDTLVNGPTESTPELSVGAAVGGQVVGQYIVVFNNDVTDPPGLARRLVAGQGGVLGRTWSTAIKGFSATLPAAAAIALANNPNVAYVEPDREGGIIGSSQLNPTWGLDRIDQEDGSDGMYNYDNDGRRATVYVLDTGVRDSHGEFGGRAEFIKNGAIGDFVGDVYGLTFGAEDCHGHGTPVSGTIGGSTYGVAKNVQIRVGRVVNCNGGGFVSTVITAVNWITANAPDPQNSVVSMSLGYGKVQSLRDVVQASVGKGIHYSVAAGNGNFGGRPKDACSESPAGAPGANTVGATDSSDQEASFSNYGTCVDILAPGVGVKSAWIDSDQDTKTISGTSMATPHVAGAIALYLTKNPGASPTAISQALKDNASADKISLHRSSRRNGTPNLLLKTRPLPGSLPQNLPPVADFAFDCTNLTCDFTDKSLDDGGVVSRSWTFGDGNTSTETDPTHLYASAETYTVTLTVTDAGGLSDMSSQQVIVSDPPLPGEEPVVAGCFESSGNPNDRLTVQVTGLNFASGATVSFGERVNVQGVTFVDSGQLDVRIKVHKQANTGFRDVTVINPDGETGIGLDCFEVI